MTIKIENDIPVPPPVTRTGVATEMREILPKMKIGDSFFIPTSEMKPQTTRVTVAKWARAHPPFHFTTRAVPNGARVWRDS